MGSFANRERLSATSPEKCENCLEWRCRLFLPYYIYLHCVAAGAAIQDIWHCHAGGILCYHDWSNWIIQDILTPSHWTCHPKIFWLNRKEFVHWSKQCATQDSTFSSCFDVLQFYRFSFSIAKFPWKIALFWPFYLVLGSTLIALTQKSEFAWKGFIVRLSYQCQCHCQCQY